MSGNEPTLEGLVWPADITRFEEKRVDSRTVYSEGFLSIRKDRIKMPDGSDSTREVISHPGAAMVIPLLEDGRVIIEQQYRYPLGKVFLEFPAGKIDHAENPRLTAARELVEETGYRAAELALVTSIHMAIGYSDEVLHIYLARGLKRVERRLDHGEYLEVGAVSPDWLDERLRAGDLSDTKTQIGLFWLQDFLAQRRPWPKFEPSPALN
jgi:ADP-ribose pyrophosphatase